MARYDPFERGAHPVGVVTQELKDTARERVFPVEIWYPAAPAPGAYPVVVYSHPGGGHRRSATYLATHLASHGYLVAAMDHSEQVDPGLAPAPDLTSAEAAARASARVAARVPDLRLLLDHVLRAGAAPAAVASGPVGVVGHSFGGWTALAAVEVEERIGAVVALAPGGNSRPLPGILDAPLAFGWARPVPVLYLAADRDTMTPLDGIQELVAKTPGAPRLGVLRDADHLHFVDEVEAEHERMRAQSFPGEGSWIPGAMPPIGELCPGVQSHAFTRGLALAHLDAVLRADGAARGFLAGDVTAELAAPRDRRDRGVSGQRPCSRRWAVRVAAA